MPKGIYQRIYPSGMKGKVTSEETKAKQRLAHKLRKPISDETRSKLKNHLKTKEHRENLSKALTGRVFTDEWRKNMSLAHRGDGGHFRGKTEWYVSPSAGRIFLKSSYESIVARWLDNNNLNWKYEDVKIPWTDSNGKSHTYFVDFHVVSEKEYCIECKGWIKKDDKLKFEAFKQTFPTMEYLIIGRKELEQYKGGTQ